MSDPSQTNVGDVIAAVVGSIPGLTALVKWRSAGDSIHKVRNIAQGAVTRVAVLEAHVEKQGERLERIENKLDRVLEQRR